MKKIKFSQNFALFFTLLFIFICFSDHLFKFENTHVFPFYNWELGFGKIIHSDRFHFVEIKALNGQIFSPPLVYRELFRRRWHATSDYKIARRAVSYLRNGNPKSVQAIKVLENILFSRIGIQSVIFQLREVKHNPRQYYQNKAVEEEIVYGDFEYITHFEED